MDQEIGPLIGASLVGDTQDGTCDADCSLREAIDAANSSGTADEVVLPAGTYVLTLGGLSVVEDLTLSGAGADVTIIDGDRGGVGHGVIDVQPTSTSLIRDVTIQGGLNEGVGNMGTLEISGCTIRDNLRGGIVNGSLDPGFLTVRDSTISGNGRGLLFLSLSFGGIGCITFNAPSTLALWNSTVSGNTDVGVSLAAGCTLDMTSTTIASNASAFSLQGGLRWGFGTIGAFTNNILANNTPANCDFAIVTSGGHNIDDDGSCGLFAILGKKMRINNPKAGSGQGVEEPKRSVNAMAKSSSGVALIGRPDDRWRDATRDRQRHGRLRRNLLPRSEWLEVARSPGYRYTSSSGSSTTPVRRVSLKTTATSTVLKVLLKGKTGTDDLNVLPASPNPSPPSVQGDLIDATVALELGDGGVKYCFALGGPAGGLVKADNAKQSKIVATGAFPASASIPCP